MNSKIPHRSDVDTNLEPATAQPHLPQALYLLDIATRSLKTRLGNMPTYSKKKGIEFALASAAENVALATALGFSDKGDE